MSRGGRGGRGRGGFGRGRGGPGLGNMPPMGLTFADIQSLSREEDALYPVGC
jgi:DNA-directed RNA polymerase III subunit RPC7